MEFNVKDVVTKVKLDNKHHLEASYTVDEHDRVFTHPRVVKSGNGVPIDLDVEPVILFRGRDKLAVKMLQYYRALCVQDGCTDYQLQSMDDMINKFEAFATSSATMKQPGCTLGK